MRRIRIRTFAEIEQAAERERLAWLHTRPATLAQIEAMRAALQQAAVDFDRALPPMKPLPPELVMRPMPKIGPGWRILDLDEPDGSVYLIDERGWVYRSDADGLTDVGWE